MSQRPQIAKVRQVKRPGICARGEYEASVKLGRNRDAVSCGKTAGEALDNLARNFSGIRFRRPTISQLWETPRTLSELPNDKEVALLTTTSLARKQLRELKSIYGRQLPAWEESRVQKFPLSLIGWEQETFDETDDDRSRIDAMKVALQAGKPLPPIAIWLGPYVEATAAPGDLLDGRHRYVAAKELGLRTVSVVGVGGSEEVQYFDESDRVREDP